MCVSPLATAQADPTPATGRRYASFPDEVVAAPDTEMDTSAAIARDLLKSLQKKSAVKRPRMPKAVETPIASDGEAQHAAPAAVIEPVEPALENHEELAAAAPAVVEPAARAPQPEPPLLHAEPLEKTSAMAQAFAEDAKLASDTIYGGAKARPVRKAKPEPVEAAAVPDPRTSSETIYGGAKSPLAAAAMPTSIANQPAVAEPAISESETIYGAVKSPLREPPIKWEARIDWNAADETPPPNTHEPVFTEEVAMPAIVKATAAAEAAAEPQAAVEPVFAREEETATVSTRMTNDTLEAEMAAAFAKVRSAANEVIEKVAHAEPHERSATQPEAVSEPEPELVAVGAPEEQSADASATTFGARTSAPAAPVFAPLAADSVAEPPAPPRTPSSTTWGRVQPSANASEDWRRELSNRVEAYRARTGPAEEAPQDPLPFVAEDDTAAQIEADLAAAEAATQAPEPEAPLPRASLRTAARRRPDTMEILALQPEFDFAAAETDERPHAPLVPVADLSERRAAGLLDTAFIVASFLAFLVCFTSLGQGKIGAGKGELAILGVAFFLFYVQYFGLFTIFGGVTPGMMIRGLRPVSFDGASPTAQQLLQRTFGYVVSAGSLLLGFLWSLWDEDHLTWHDRMSHTYLTHAAPQSATDER